MALEIAGGIGSFLGSLFGGLFGNKNAQVAQVAMELKHGDLTIQLDPESKCIIFGVEESDNITPIIFDLRTGLISGAQIDQSAAPSGPVA
jgi:hypothetical protein